MLLILVSVVNVLELNEVQWIDVIFLQMISPLPQMVLWTLAFAICCAYSILPIRSWPLLLRSELSLLHSPDWTEVQLEFYRDCYDHPLILVILQLMIVLSTWWNDKMYSLAWIVSWAAIYTPFSLSFNMCTQIRNHGGWWLWINPKVKYYLPFINHSDPLYCSSNWLRSFRT